MGTLRYFRKIVRPSQVIIAGLSTWIVALISNGPTWVSYQKVGGGMVIALSILSASVWHYGARHDVYQEKWWDPIYVKNPKAMCFLGLLGFLASIAMALFFLPKECVIIAIFNALAIVLYAKRLDQFWPWKNIIIALVCITPLLMGWFLGHRINFMVPFLTGAAFCIYLAREILKDVVDREADRGKRFTMVMQLGINATLRIAGLVLVLAIILIISSLLKGAAISNSSLVAFAAGIMTLLVMAITLLTGKDISKKYQIIDIGVGAILVGLLLVRVNMY